ncbi:MAG: hypothetical protein AAB336_07920 [Acidobacteriota bacterium]
MLPTRIFQESPFKALKLLVAILAPIFLFFAFLVLSEETPQITSNGLNKSAQLLAILGGVSGGVFLLTFLILSFQARKTLKCDYERCEILQKNFWSTVGFLTQFKWIEVTDSNIVEQELEIDGSYVSVYTFAVKTEHGQINLLDLKTSSKNNIQGLINYVNKATPNLKYIWIKDSEIGSRLAVDSIYGYSKVGRN